MLTEGGLVAAHLLASALWFAFLRIAPSSGFPFGFALKTLT
jgi:hypothetical protein